MTNPNNTIEFLWFDLPVVAVLWLGLAVLVAVAVLAGVFGLRLGSQPRRGRDRARDIARAVVNEVMGTDPTRITMVEPVITTRVITPEGHPWIRTPEGYWESVEAPHVVATWKVLAGMPVRIDLPPLSLTRNRVSS